MLPNQYLPKELCFSHQKPYHLSLNEMVSISGMMYVHHRNTWKECVWGEFYIGHNSPNDFWAFDFVSQRIGKLPTHTRLDPYIWVDTANKVRGMYLMILFFEFPIIWILGINTCLQPICHMISQKTIIQTYTKYKSTHTQANYTKNPRLHTNITFSYIFAHLLSPTNKCHLPTPTPRQASIRRAHLGRLRCPRSRRQRWQAQLNAPWPRVRWMDFSNVDMETRDFFKKREGEQYGKFSWKIYLSCKNERVFDALVWLVGWFVWLVGLFGWLGCLFVCFINMNVCMYVCTCRKCVYTEYITKNKQK